MVKMEMGAAPKVRGEEPPHIRKEAPRLFNILGMLARVAGPQARRELGLSDFEWRVMAQVGYRAPMSLNELAGITRHDKGQLSRGVKRLVEAGLLVRESRRGSRGVFISPTPAGAVVFDRIVDLAIRQNEMLIAGLTPEELKVFTRVLDQMEANVRRAMADEHANYAPSPTA